MRLRALRPTPSFEEDVERGRRGRHEGKCLEVGRVPASAGQNPKHALDDTYGERLQGLYKELGISGGHVNGTATLYALPLPVTTDKQV
jgi:hypothetical protein